jgi:hypothetical protein
MRVGGLGDICHLQTLSHNQHPRSFHGLKKAVRRRVRPLIAKFVWKHYYPWSRLLRFNFHQKHESSYYNSLERIQGMALSITERAASLTTTSQPSHSRVHLLLVAAVIFRLDCVTPLGFTVSMLYVPLCLACLWLRGWRFAFLMEGVCSVLILIGFVASPSGNLFVFSVPDRSMALFTLWASPWAGSSSPSASSMLQRTQAILGQEAEQ